MKEFLLFIDTEASCLPNNWSAPYSTDNNWPYAVQISWIICKNDGTEVKYENYYVADDDFKITATAEKIHGITRAFLNKEGVSRKEILSKLTADINQHKPLIVGHFMELDYHVLAADFFRSGIENPLKQNAMFCTMLATKGLLPYANRTFLKLCHLYSLLFNKELNDQHNALADARATAECFFELQKRGHITDEKIKQQNILNLIARSDKKTGCSHLFIFLSLITVFIFSFL